jgi:hypothetical protein
MSHVDNVRERIHDLVAETSMRKRAQLGREALNELEAIRRQLVRYGAHGVIRAGSETRTMSAEE